jgi:hypothetical protein
MKPLKQLLVLSVMAFGAVQAASTTQSYTTHTATAQTLYTPSSLAFTPEIPLFDTSLGVLIKVDVEFKASATGDFLFINEGETSGSVTGSSKSKFTLVGPGKTGNLIDLTSQLDFNSVVGAGSAAPVYKTTANSIGTFSSETASVLAAFSGNGFVGFSGLVSEVGSPTLNFAAGRYASSLVNSAALAVKYTYASFKPTAVPAPVVYMQPLPPEGAAPEPATWVFMAGGGLLFLAIGRFRKKPTR